MKKTLSLILALLMAASTATFAFADEAEAIAEEAIVEEEAEVVVTPYDGALEFLNSLEIMIGDENGDLMANQDVKRYQMALLMGRVATGWVDPKQWEDGTSNSSIFTDLVGDSADYLGAISYVNQKGIIEGYGDGTFGPDKVVTYRDALVMAVRTLGYGSGYDYPWDYIEKAVGLGLTADISDVIYTDEINRGVAGQIVYNMLFAATKDGDTLAMRSFGVEYGWQNIMITANTYGAYAAGEKDTDKGIAFRVLNSNGTLDDTTYYVENRTDLELGRVYNALFEKDVDGEYVTLIATSEYTPTLVENKGLTDDEGNEIDYEIEDFLKSYTIVDKYSDKILTNKGKLNNEIIIADAYNQATVIKEKDGEESPYAIDWDTGNILVKKDGAWTVEWYYNSKLEVYFDYSDVDTVGESAAIGIELMDDEDVAKIREEIEKTLKEEVEVDSYKLLGGSPAKSAYAALEVYDLDGDETADYGVYESYRFGKFSTASKKCSEDSFDGSDNDDKHDAYVLETLSLANVDNKDNFKENGGNNYVIIADGACPKCDEDEGHFAEGFEPSKDEDGNYVNGYVIYGINRSTKEIKIIKEIGKIGESSDIDSYYATGVVRGNSVSGKTVTIDNTRFSYDYNELMGTAFTKVSDHKGTYSDLFDGLFQQFVEYVVVDDKLVYVAAKGSVDKNYIVVEDYYGIDSDNYIVVSGYVTSDLDDAKALEYNTFRIASYDGWTTGSAFNYKVIEDEFDKGTVYKITSRDTDAENGVVYNVTSIGNAVDGKVEGNFKATNATVKFEDNRRVIGSETRKVSSDDKYVIIANTGTGYMPIYVFEGKVTNTKWEVTGDLLVKEDHLVIVVNAKDIVGFNADTTKTGYVAILDKKITEREFDGYGDEDGYYIYGAATYDCEAFNLMNADKVTVEATNIKIEEGKIYRTIDNVIVDKVALSGFAGFKTEVQAAYKNADPDTANYKFANITLNKSEITLENKDNVDKKWISKNVISDLLWMTGDYDDLINGYKVRLVKGDVDDVVELKKWSDLGENVVAVDAFLIYNVKNGDVVIYVDADDADTKVESNDKPLTSTNKIEVGTDAYIIADTVYDVVETKVNGVSTYATTVKSINFRYEGEATTDTHAAVLHDGHYFAIAGECDVEDWKTTVKVTGDVADELYGSLVAGTYDDHTDEDTYSDYDCKLVDEVAVNIKDTTLKAGQWTNFTVTFTGVKHGATYEYLFTPCFNVDGSGKIVEFKFATGANENVIRFADGNSFDYQNKLVAAD